MVLWTDVLSYSLQGPQHGMLEGTFALCISLYHGYELLMQMGLRSLFFYIQGIMDGSRGRSPDLLAFSVFRCPFIPQIDQCSWVYDCTLDNVSCLCMMFDICILHALFGSEMSRARNELQRTPTLVDLYREMEAMFVKPSAGN